jgi:hypothetical protein
LIGLLLGYLATQFLRFKTAILTVVFSLRMRPHPNELLQQSRSASGLL